jgi:hypothetical protein
MVDITGGMREPVSLTLNTHSAPGQTNVLVLNCDRGSVADKPFSSDFVYDIVRRNKVPFNGIALNVHVNASIPVADR